MIEQALKYLKDEFGKPFRAENQVTQTSWFIPVADGTYDLIEIPKEVKTSISFGDLASFVAAAKELPQARVAVGDDVQLMSDSELLFNGRLSLSPPEEFLALKALMVPASLANFREVLVTKLDGHIEEALALQLERVTLSSSKKNEFRVGASGLNESSRDKAFSIQYNGDGQTGGQTVRLRENWVFDGRFFACWERRFQIQLKLAVSVKDDELTLCFVPVKLVTALELAKAELVAYFASEGLRAYSATVKREFI